MHYIVLYHTLYDVLHPNQIEQSLLSEILILIGSINFFNFWKIDWLRIILAGASHISIKFIGSLRNIKNCLKCLNCMYLIAMVI